MEFSERQNRLSLYRRKRLHKPSFQRIRIGFIPQSEPSKDLQEKLRIQIHEAGFSTLTRNYLQRNIDYLSGSIGPDRPFIYKDAHDQKLVAKGYLPLVDLSDLSRIPDPRLKTLRRIGKKTLAEIRSRIPYISPQN